ncbi:MAG TPA: rhodanese-like domain-containing protein [Gammaproteobacteria bacterium]|nr:rhodanese-like domain-containing protein [Gammaproteobacteria bacterium]
MSRLLEFTQHHPFQVGLLGLAVLALIGDELLRRMRKYKEVGAAQAVLLINKGAPVLDLRAPGEFSAGHIINARNVPLSELEGRVSELQSLKGQPLLLCCKDGNQSGNAAARLAKLGFGPLTMLKGGIEAWQREQFPLERGS